MANSKLNLNKYFDFHVCLSFRPPSAAVCACVRKLALIPAVVQQNITNKSCLVCVMSENIHFGSPSDPSQTPAAKAKLRYVYSILKPHGQSSRSPVRPLLSKAKPSYVYSILKPQSQSFRNPNYCSQQHSITSPFGFRIE